MPLVSHGSLSNGNTETMCACVCGSTCVCVCVSNLLGEALLGLDLVVLLGRHPGDAGRARPRQRLHLLDGLHGNDLGEHLEERRHVHDDALLVRVRHGHICGAERREV